MRNNRQFVSWMLAIGLLLVGGGRLLGMAAVLAIPEPLPPLSPATHAQAYESWPSYPSDDQFGDIVMMAVGVSGILDNKVNPDAPCGRYQFDVMDNGDIDLGGDPLTITFEYVIPIEMWDRWVAEEERKKATERAERMFRIYLLWHSFMKT